MEREDYEKFLRYVMENHIDNYGHLQIVQSGDEFDPTVENVVTQYIADNK
jgi:hypothetical protein